MVWKSVQTMCLLPHPHLQQASQDVRGLGPSAELKTLPPDVGLGKGRGLPSETSGAGPLGPNIANWPCGSVGHRGLAEGRARSFPGSQEDSVTQETFSLEEQRGGSSGSSGTCSLTSGVGVR